LQSYRYLATRASFYDAEEKGGNDTRVDAGHLFPRYYGIELYIHYDSELSIATLAGNPKLRARKRKRDDEQPWKQKGKNTVCARRWIADSENRSSVSSPSRHALFAVFPRLVRANVAIRGRKAKRGGRCECVLPRTAF
jgi:hypothetical protein